MNTDRLRFLGAFLLIGAVAATGLHAYSPGFVPAAPLHPTSLSDTLEQSADAGSVLITALPAPPDTTDVAYEVIRAPALSWLVDRSFFWDTRRADAGEHEVLFRRTRGSRTDTLVLAINLTR